ncbi:hypothetical protein CapIbe_020545 [Capra ibex]
MQAGLPRSLLSAQGTQDTGSSLSVLEYRSLANKDQPAGRSGKLLPTPGHVWLAVPSTWNIQLQTFLCTTGFFSSFQPPSEVCSERPAKIAH